MKKFNLTIIACIIAILVLSMIAIQPTATEASNNATPTTTPRKRINPAQINARGKTRKQPLRRQHEPGCPCPTPLPSPTPAPITKVKTN